jgi:hypothetical protein
MTTPSNLRLIGIGATYTSCFCTSCEGLQRGIFILITEWATAHAPQYTQTWFLLCGRGRHPVLMLRDLAGDSWQPTYSYMLEMLTLRGQEAPEI